MEKVLQTGRELFKFTIINTVFAMQYKEVSGIISSTNKTKEEVLYVKNKLLCKELKLTIQKKIRGDMA